MLSTRTPWLCLLFSLTLPAQFTWRDVTPASGGPRDRSGHAMAFDAARGVTVLFGGRRRTALLGDTWTFDGTTWRQVAATGPAPRELHAMAFDAATQRVVLFGGSDGSSARNAETWEWDGVAWQQRTPATVPPGRWQHAMAHVPALGGVLIHGGNTPTATGDLWLWSGGNWRDLTGADTPALAGHAMAFHEGLQHLVVNGGYDRSTNRFIASTWIWDLSRWTLQEQLSPVSARYGGNLVYDRNRDHLVLIGGHDWPGGGGSYPSATFTWRGVWSQVDMIGAGFGGERFAAAFDAARDRLVVQGGEYVGLSFGTVYDATLELTPTQLPPPFVAAGVAGFGLTTACATAAGKSLLHTGGERPWINEPLRVYVDRVGGLSSPTPVMLGLGVSRTAWAGQPLPLALAALGRPDCSVHCSIDASLSALARGVAGWTLPIPNCAPCVGSSVFAQMFGLEAGRLLNSNALELRLGRR